MEGSFPGDEVRTAISNLEVNGNPFGLAYAARDEWADELNVAIMEQDSSVDILYFVGCYASFDKRNREVARSFVRICSAAGIKLGILGKGEKCCGEPARKLGNEYLDFYYIGRYMDILDPLRTVLQVAGGRLTEMERSG